MLLRGLSDWSSQVIFRSKMMPRTAICPLVHETARLRKSLIGRWSRTLCKHAHRAQLVSIDAHKGATRRLRESAHEENREAEEKRRVRRGSVHACGIGVDEKVAQELRPQLCPLL